MVYDLNRENDSTGTRYFSPGSAGAAYLNSNNREPYMTKADLTGPKLPASEEPQTGPNKKGPNSTSNSGGNTTPVSNPAVPSGTTDKAGNVIDPKIRETLVNNKDAPVLPGNTTQVYTPLSENANEFVDPNSYNIKEQEKQTASTYEAAKVQMLTAEQAMNEELKATGAISPTTAATYNASKANFTQVQSVTKGHVSQLATGASASAAVAEAAYKDLDTVNPKTLAEALTHDVPNQATVKGQLDGLLEGLETGEVPQWAKPAVAQAEAALAAKGLSVSSVGKQAMFNSIIQAAMPIAQADAAAKLSVFQQDITNEQQAILANSQFFQTLTLKNLDNKQQAAIVNATNATNASIATAQNMTQASISNANAFLQMDITNLNNEQQSAVINAQIRQQTLLSNQSAENTAKQFNAANQQQADQFNTNLAASIAQFNSTQLTAANQFNANSENAMKQFNSNINFQRDQFNVQNATAIEQSNVQWRRQMNQANTAGINAVNQANAMNQFNLSNQALAFLWQEQRDAASWANSNLQNEEERKTRLTIAALGNESMKDATTLNNIKELAGAAVSLLDNWKST